MNEAAANFSRPGVSSINAGGNHWVLIVVHLDKKTIDFYDSYHQPGQKYIDLTMRWLDDMHRHEKKLDKAKEGSLAWLEESQGLDY
jgi:hypothetical protein